MTIDFPSAFAALTNGKRPFLWQRRLFNEFVRGDIPNACDIPTGLGKTSVIPIWLLALAAQAADGATSLPRRLVYVVNRRTVVDQATDTAMDIRRNLLAEHPSQAVLDIVRHLRSLCVDPETPLAISTLRGELADNREWQADPTRPAIIIGTVDMIGSKLLFSGYGVSRRMRPFHAGLIGHDVLLVHDEAHLTPPFGKLINQIAALQKRRGEPRPLHLLELSATQRTAGNDSRFRLRDNEAAEEDVHRRVHASKTLHLKNVPATSGLEAQIAELALAHDQVQKRVLVYVRSPRSARDIADRIAHVVGENRVAILAGTVRGHERDLLAASSLFSGFRPAVNRRPPAQSEYLVATSAGEVGVDLDADHLVCDLVALDSMIQRLGRVNRLGRTGAQVQVLEAAANKRTEKASADADERLAATKEALQSLPLLDGGYDASPHALRTLAARDDAFSKEPRCVPLTEVLLDAWSLTRLAEMPGRPPVERWLHGVEGSAPELYVAWRQEVPHIIEADRKTLKNLYDKHPILSRERLRGRLKEVTDELKKIAKRSANAQAILLPASGDPEAASLVDMIEDEVRLREGTIVLPVDVGGLDERGMLDGSKISSVPDVADVPQPQTRDAESSANDERMRVLLRRDPETDNWSACLLGASDQQRSGGEVFSARNPRQAVRAVIKQLPAMAEKDILTLAHDENGEPSKVLLLLARSTSIETAQDSPAAAAAWQELDEHGLWAREEAKHIAKKLTLSSIAPDIADAIVIAAHWHDCGKNRAGWQKAIGHAPPPELNKNEYAWKPWAKSGRRGFDDSACGRYRHEFGSLREASDDPAISGHPERDLILHLIAAHHGWARPHFEPVHWDVADDVTEDDNAAIATEVLRRFARLQRRFGHWGLAWIESLVRAADYAATERLSNRITDADGVTT